MRYCIKTENRENCVKKCVIAFTINSHPRSLVDEIFWRKEGGIGISRNVWVLQKNIFALWKFIEISFCAAIFPVYARVSRSNFLALVVEVLSVVYGAVLQTIDNLLE